MSALIPLETLLLIGASTRATAWSASRSGFRTVCLDLFADRDTAEYAATHMIDSYPDSIVAQAAAIQADAVVLTGGMENHPSVVAELERHFRILGPNSQQIRALRNIDNMQRWCGADIRFPEVIRDSSDLSLLACSYRTGAVGEKAASSSSWLMKSYRSSAGFGVKQWTAESPIDFSASYLQRRVEGDSIGIVCLSTGQGVEWVGATRNLTLQQTARLLDSSIVAEFLRAAGLYDSILRSKNGSTIEPSNQSEYVSDFAYSGNQTLSHFSQSQRNAISTWMQFIVEEIDYRGVIQADFITTSRGETYLLEFNPRWTAGMELIELSTARRLMQEHVTASSRQSIHRRHPEADPSMQPVGTPAVSKLILYASHRIPVTAELSNHMMSHRFQADAGSTQTSIGWSDIPNPGIIIERNAPIATILFN